MPTHRGPSMNALVNLAASVRTTCPYCGVGCGLKARPDARGGVAVAGDPDHPANLGRLCSKGSALGETVGLEGRLLHPMLRRADGALVRAGWTRGARPSCRRITGDHRT